MTQDCLNSPSTADVSKRLPKGIHVIGAERLSDPSVEGISQRKRIRKKEDPSTNPTSWSYIFILHMAAKGMEKWLEKFNADEKNIKQPYFIHKTLRYSYKDEEKQQGVKKDFGAICQRTCLLARYGEGPTRISCRLFSPISFSQRPQFRATCIHQGLHHAALYECDEDPSGAGYIPS